VRAQSAPLNSTEIFRQWNSKATLGNLGVSAMSQEVSTALFGRVYPEGAGVIDYTVKEEGNDG